MLSRSTSTTKTAPTAARTSPTGRLNSSAHTYSDKYITKWDIFYYIYAVLHHPEYRKRYAANLKRELPRIPYAPDFHAFAKAGKRLAELHVDYEKQKEYPLERREKPGEKLNLRVEKMRLSKDKQTLVYNDFLTLTGIPKETYDYRLGNRSALEWVIDQYQVSTDKRSGITNDPNRDDDQEYILRLIGQVITVSLETVKIVNALPDLGLPKELERLNDNPMSERITSILRQNMIPVFIMRCWQRKSRSFVPELSEYSLSKAARIAGRPHLLVSATLFLSW